MTKEHIAAHPRSKDIVDGVLGICEALSDDWSTTDLITLFGMALEGGRQFACIKMTMIAHALGQLPSRAVESEAVAEVKGKKSIEGVRVPIDDKVAKRMGFVNVEAMKFWRAHEEIRKERDKFQKLNESLTERVKAQSDLLTQRAERPDLAKLAAAEQLRNKAVDCVAWHQLNHWNPDTDGPFEEALVAYDAFKGKT